MWSATSSDRYISTYSCIYCNVLHYVRVCHSVKTVCIVCLVLILEIVWLCSNVTSVLYSLSSLSKCNRGNTE